MHAVGSGIFEEGQKKIQGASTTFNIFMIVYCSICALWAINSLAMNKRVKKINYFFLVDYHKETT